MTGCTRRALRRALFIVAGGLALTSCGREPPPPAKPVFYTELASASARVDAASARDLFNGYRGNLGLAPLVLDPQLMAEAERKAEALALAGAVADGSKGASGKGTSGKGTSGKGAGREEIVSAGYYTVSDAFSGWRGSPSHDRKLRTAAARRLGIATAYAPNSKYKVYWVVILSP
ncbi:MAG: CAP domain-containing protein [Beijerinckiaceae bacterium]|nr:CAP domain-containing protein [Beijerinckiaceae bacterium]